MMVKRLLLVSLLASTGLAQNAGGPPKLKDSIALELRTLQLQISNGNVQILQIQQQQAQWENQYVARLRTALKDSDLDDTKYDLDLNTFAVKEKPAHAEEHKK